MVDKAWAISVHDEIVEANGSLLVREAQEKFAERYIADVNAGHIKRQKRSLKDEADALFTKLVLPNREARRKSMKRDFDYITDSLFGIEDGMTLDPIMACAYPTGTGHDKTLREWSVEDFETARVVRYRSAAEQAAAAADFDASVQPIIDAMKAAGVPTLGALMGKRVDA